MLLEEISLKRGYQVTTANDGESAWLIYIESPDKFDVVLTDHLMPKLEGFGLVKRIREHGFATLTVLMTGLMDVNEIKGDKLFFSLLQKPMERESILKLFSKLEKALKFKSSITDGTKHHSSAPRILVVDDEPELRQLLVEILQKANYRTGEAEDGLKAIEKWQQALCSNRQYDLILTDLRMPNMDGPALIEKIRNTDEEIPIVVITGHGQMKEAHRLLEKFHIADFLTKPLDGSFSLLFSIASALEKSKLTNSLKKLNRDLEYRVYERTIELQLTKVQVQSASDAKSKFIGSINHELRTPLNAMIGFSRILKRKLKDSSSEELEMLDIICDAGKHLASLVNNVLDLPMIEQGLYKYDLTECSIQEIIDLTLIWNSDEIRNKNIEYDVKISPDITPLVIADKHATIHLFNNLISNAIKYNVENGSLILSVCETGDNTIKISFQDTGIGIPENKQPELFQTFNRLGSEMSTISGFGLGLVISKNLVEQMKGNIGFNSEEGVGSTFWIELPIASGSINTKPV